MGPELLGVYFPDNRLWRSSLANAGAYHPCLGLFRYMLPFMSPLLKCKCTACQRVINAFSPFTGQFVN